MMFDLSDNPDAIEEMGKKLEALELSLKSSLATENGLVLRNKDGKGDTWKPKTPSYKCNPLKLRKRKTPASQRIGVRAEMLKKAAKIDVTSSNSQTPELKPGTLLVDDVTLDTIDLDTVNSFEVSYNSI